VQQAVGAARALGEQDHGAVFLQRLEDALDGTDIATVAFDRDRLHLVKHQPSRRIFQRFFRAKKRICRGT